MAAGDEDTKRNSATSRTASPRLPLPSSSHPAQVNPPRGQKARFLKFTIQSGYADFATINRWEAVRCRDSGQESSFKLVGGGDIIYIHLPSSAMPFNACTQGVGGGLGAGRDG